MKTKRLPKLSTKRAASMRAAAAMLKIPIAWIRAAKDAGVEAFTANGTVDLDPIRAWIRDNQKALEAKSGDLTLREQKLVEEVRRLRLRNDLEEKKLVPVSYIEQQDMACCSNWHAARIKVEQEWPPRLAGKDIPECRAVLRELTSEIGRILKHLRD